MKSAVARHPPIATPVAGALAASVVVCTHNRASLLPGLVAAVGQQEVHGGFDILVVDSASTDETATVAAGLAGPLVAAVGQPEVHGGFDLLVVDSASTDETATVAAGLAGPLVAAVGKPEVHGGFDLLVVDSASTDETTTVAAGLAGPKVPRVRAVHAAEPGLCVARNRGLATTAGAIVVFIDDDAVPHPGWLGALIAPFEDPLVGCAGGPVSLRFPGAVPPWLVPPLRAFLTAYDLGPTSRAVSYSAGMEDYPRGANFAVRREAAGAAGGFRRLFERRGARLRSNDELDLCYRLERCGWRLRYAADARVDHLVMPERLHPTWFLRRFGAQGESDALFLLANRGLRAAFGRLRWCHASRLGRTPYAPGDDPDPARLLAECERRAAWGFVRGLLGGLPILLARGRGVSFPRQSVKSVVKHDPSE